MRNLILKCGLNSQNLTFILLSRIRKFTKETWPSSLFMSNMFPMMSIIVNLLHLLTADSFKHFRQSKVDIITVYNKLNFYILHSKKNAFFLFSSSCMCLLVKFQEIHQTYMRDKIS